MAAAAFHLEAQAELVAALLKLTPAPWPLVHRLVCLAPQREQLRPGNVWWGRATACARVWVLRMLVVCTGSAVHVRQLDAMASLASYFAQHDGTVGSAASPLAILLGPSG